MERQNLTIGKIISEGVNGVPRIIVDGLANVLASQRPDRISVVPSPQVEEVGTQGENNRAVQ